MYLVLNVKVYQTTHARVLIHANTGSENLWSSEEIKPLFETA